MSICPTCAVEFQGPNIYRVGCNGTWKKCPNGHYFRKQKPVRLTAAQTRVKIRNEVLDEVALIIVESCGCVVMQERILALKEKE